MPLTATAAKVAKPKDKPYKLSDEKGLYLLINPKGAKYWRLKYRYGGKEKTLALGVYPEVSLAEALQLESISVYAAQTTGKKFLINPSKN